MYGKEEIEKLKSKLEDLNKIEDIIDILQKLNNLLLEKHLSGEDLNFFQKKYKEVIEFIENNSNFSNNLSYLEYKSYFYYLENKPKRLLNLINSNELLFLNNDLLVLLVDLLIKNNYDKESIFEYVDLILKNGFSEIYTINFLERILIGKYFFDLSKIDKGKFYEELDGGGVILPIKLNGLWDLGYCLDNHTILDNNSKGYSNSYLGELLNKLKYDLDIKKADKLGIIMSDFINGKYNKIIKLKKPFDKIDFLITVPPSKLDRPFQPVLELGRKISNFSGILLKESLLEKIKVTPQTKNLTEKEAKNILSGVFRVKNTIEFENKNVLIIDDLFGTGTTINEITNTIRKSTKVNKIFILTATKTRTKSGIRQK